MVGVAGDPLWVPVRVPFCGLFRGPLRARFRGLKMFQKSWVRAQGSGFRVLGL